MNPERPDSLREDFTQQDVRESLEAQLAQAEGHIRDLEGEIADLRAHMNGLDHGMCEPCAICYECVVTCAHYVVTAEVDGLPADIDEEADMNYHGRHMERRSHSRLD